MKRFLIFKISIIIAILISQKFSYAQRYEGNLTGRIHLGNNVGSLGFLSIETIEGVHNFRIVEESTRRLMGRKEVNEDARFFKAESKRRSIINGSKLGASITLVDEKLTVTFRGRRSGHTFIASTEINVKNVDGRLVGVAKVHRYPLFGEAHCGTMMSNMNLFNSIPRKLSNIGSNNLTMSISIDADHEYYRYRARAIRSKRRALNRVRNDIRTVINGVESIYFDQFGIKFVINTIKVDNSRSRPYHSRDPDKLLSQFRRFVLKSNNLGKADQYHLFSGKQLSETVVGLAYVATLCRSDIDNYAFSLSKRTPIALHILIMAHELAHTMGATHIDGDRSLMSPILSEANNRFVNGSLNEINQHIAQYGSCLN